MARIRNKSVLPESPLVLSFCEKEVRKVSSMLGGPLVNLRESTDKSQTRWTAVVKLQCVSLKGTSKLM